MRVANFLVLFVGALLLTVPSPGLGMIVAVKCVTATTCAGGASNCRSETYCWTLWEMDPGPMYSLGAGYVVQAGSTSLNGNYVRVAQGDGNTVTYIHLLSRSVATGDEVGVGTKLGEMNCTGDCGGAAGSPERGKINHTHVHIQVKRTDDSSAYLDAIDLYGGEGCSAAPTPSPGPGQQCPLEPIRVGSHGGTPRIRNCLI